MRLIILNKLPFVSLGILKANNTSYKNTSANTIANNLLVFTEALLGL